MLRGIQISRYISKMFTLLHYSENISQPHNGFWVTSMKHRNVAINTPWDSRRFNIPPLAVSSLRGSNFNDIIFFPIHDLFYRGRPMKNFWFLDGDGKYLHKVLHPFWRARKRIVWRPRKKPSGQALSSIEVFKKYLFIDL